MTPSNTELTFSDLVQFVRIKFADEHHLMGYADAAKIVDKAIEPQFQAREQQLLTELLGKKAYHRCEGGWFEYVPAEVIERLQNKWAELQADTKVSDLAANSPNTNTDLSNPQEQRIAEYKQLLDSLPKYKTFPTDTREEWKYREGHNKALDQCRAIIQKHIEEME